MTRITKDTTIGEALQIDAGIIPILMGIGMRYSYLWARCKRAERKTVHEDSFSGSRSTVIGGATGG